jgi:hypothetical protein
MNVRSDSLPVGDAAQELVHSEWLRVGVGGEDRTQSPQPLYGCVIGPTRGVEMAGVQLLDFD